jgi:type IV pilus assembly protein PilC
VSGRGDHAGADDDGPLMTAYAYGAINAEGRELFGELNAPSVDAAREQLRANGLLPDWIEELEAETGHAAVGSFKRVKTRSLQIFSRQFATMIEAGLSVVTSLVILEEQTDDRVLAEVTRQVRTDVEGGALLSQALERHPRVFSRLFVAMVEAGEAAGILDVVLDRVALQIEKEAAIRRRVKGAMIYPTLVFCFAVCVLIAMLLFLVPTFTNLFAQLHGHLPFLTRIVVGASNTLRHGWFVVFPALILVPFGLRAWKQTPGGRDAWDRTKLQLPLRIGDTVLKVTMARFTRTLSSLVAAGVDIIKALEITEQASGNVVVAEALADVRIRVQEGVPIGVPIAENPIFPPMISQMVKVGEETGELDKMLRKIADFYEEEVEVAISSLTSIIEPVMIIGVGAIVGIIILSMYLPIFKLYSLIK